MVASFFFFFFLEKAHTAAEWRTAIVAVSTHMVDGLLSERRFDPVHAVISPYKRGNIIFTPINNHLNVGLRSPTPMGSVKMTPGLPENSRYPGHFLRQTFFAVFSLNHCRRAARTFSIIGRLSFSFCSHYYSTSVERQRLFKSWPYLFLLCVRDNVT